MGRNATLKKQREAGASHRPKRHSTLSDVIRSREGTTPNQAAFCVLLDTWSKGLGLTNPAETIDVISHALTAVDNPGELAALFGALGALAYSTRQDPVMLTLDLEEALASLLALTSRLNLQGALRGYGQRLPNQQPFSAINGLKSLHERRLLELAPGWHDHPRAGEIVDRIQVLGHIDCHLDAAADIAAGRCVHDAGQLVLHRRARDADDKHNRELCLSFRSADGCLSFFPRKGERLKPEAVRSMRAFVSSYSGETLSGTISPHPMAARVCRLAGLRVEGGRGVLEGKP